MKASVRLQSTFCTSPRVVVCLLALILMVGVSSAIASIPGSIQTTLNDGTTVNANLMPSKEAAYLNGGPQNENSAGLPVGTYYFQVTDPNGSVLLSTDDVTCRQVVVVLGTSGKGIVGGHPSGAPPASCTEPAGSATPGAFHNNGGTDASNGGSIPIQLCAPSGCPAGSPDYLDTPNAGGEYKVWLISVDDYNNCGAAPSSKNNFCFQNGDTKTDNFKVQPPSNIKVCKFNDENDDGIQNNGEPLIPHWPITATGVNGGTVNAQTDDSGCISFAVTGFTNPDGTQTVTLTEGTQGSGWTQTAPSNGACTLTATSGSPNGADTCTVTGGVITLTISPGETLSASNFGNFNPNDCGTGCPFEPPVVTKTANPSFTRTFTWGITKSVDNTLIDTSSSATFNYTVNVTHDSGTDSGWQATGSIRVSNPNSSDMTNVTVSDAVDNGGNCTVDSTGFSGTIPANSHFDFPYTCTYGSLPSPGTNTATALSDDGQGQGTASVNFANATINVVDGSVTVTDTFGGTLGTVSSSDPSPKTFTYSHTFSGDPAGTCTTHDNTATFTTDTTSTTGSDSQSVKVCVGADLTVSKTATPTFNSNISKSPNQTEFDTSSGSSVTITYTVTVTESGWQVAGNITIANPNDWEDITANLSDAIPGASCTVNGGTTSVVVNRSSSVTVPYTCTFASAPSSANGTNTATAGWTGGFTPDTSANGSANYTFGSLTVTDAFNGGGAVTLGTITTPAATSTFTDPHTVTAPTATCTTFNNTAALVETSQTASASVKVCGASPLTVTKTATPAFTSGISKAVDNTRINTTSGSPATFNYTITVTESGWNVTGTITVSNPNNWEAITANVADTLPSTSCSVTPNSSQSVPPSGAATWTYTCNFSSAPSASGTNTATASWDATAAHTADSSATGSQGYTFGSLTVTDSFKGALGVISVPAASTVFTYSRTITAPTATCITFPNTATITETSQSFSQSVEVCGFSPLTVNKTAATNYNATVKKTSGQTSPVEGGSSNTLTYTITVTESGWTVSGNITVTNPNNWEPVTVNIADALSIVGGSCSIIGETTQTVPASGAITPGYTCTFASAPAASGNNTAMASWSSRGSSSGTTFIVAGSASSGAVPFVFQLLNVTDQFNGGTTKTLGSNLVPAASYSFNDSYTVTVAPGTCQAFPNVATLGAVGTPPNASVTLGPPANVSVTVCDTNTGALTMGFWKNNNGQGIITKSCGGTGGLTLVQFLAGNGTTWPGFNPFKDDTPTTCKAEATYVSNILSGATCSSSGNTCNPMLRAQMLATALDVYFSDPTLGGNQIGAFNNLGNKTPALGGVAIDLSHICDGGDGGLGGSCPEDARRVFGICTGSNTPVAGCTAGVLGTTVLNMLLYSDFASGINGNPVATPNTGATWYNQIKGSQVLAKDTFDAINNQIAPIAPSGVGSPSF